MTEKWFSGPPPSLGWWPASRFRRAHFLRWWDGEKWSHGAFRGATPLMAAIAAARPSIYTDILWTHRPNSWPEHSKT